MTTAPHIPASGMDAWRAQSSRKSAYAASVPAMPGGNTPWAQQYGSEIKKLIERQAARAPRSVQVHLGPSELGSSCHRQIVGKLVAVAPTNHVKHFWPAILGTAAHAWLAQAFEDENARIQVQRFLTELSVTPVPGHSGTTDLYDRFWEAVVDHKVLGPSSLAKISSGKGPSRLYRVQLLLYFLGCLNAGLPAKRIVLIAYPRTAATLDGLYVWEHIPGPEDAALLAEVLRDTELRKKLAREVLSRRMTLEQVPITPGEDCIWCDQFRPQAARDLGPGCPGTSIGQGSL
jgi:hypothetical protein